MIVASGTLCLLSHDGLSKQVQIPGALSSSGARPVLLHGRAVVALSKRYCCYVVAPSDLMVVGKDWAKVSQCAEVVKRKPAVGGRISGKGCRGGNGGFS